MIEIFKIYSHRKTILALIYRNFGFSNRTRVCSEMNNYKFKNNEQRQIDRWMETERKIGCIHLHTTDLKSKTYQQRSRLCGMARSIGKVAAKAQNERRQRDREREKRNKQPKTMEK